MKVGIVGAGITGLALTHHLAEHDVESITLEAADEPGGVISTRTVEGHICEAGPQRMRRTPGVDALIDAAGLEDEVIECQQETLYVYTDGSLGEAPLSIRQFLRTDLLSWRGKARLIAEPLTSHGRPEESVEELFVRKFGREAYERFIGPLYGGIYGSDPAAMPAAFALDGLLEREQATGSFLQAFRQRVGSGHESPPISFPAGNQQLPNALADVYADRIEYETRVTAIQPEAGDGSPAGANRASGGYVLQTESDSYEVDEVIVTTPASVTADLLAEVEEAGLADGIGDLRDLRYNPLALVFLDADVNRSGKGYQVAYDADLHTLGVSWNASMFGRDGVHTAFLGGMHEPELLDRSDDELGSIAASELERVLDCSADVLDVVRLDPGFPAWDESWWLLEDVELPDDITLATNYTSRMGIPSRVREARELAAAIAERSPTPESQEMAADPQPVESD